MKKKGYDKHIAAIFGFLIGFWSLLIWFEQY